MYNNFSRLGFSNTYQTNQRKAKPATWVQDFKDSESYDITFFSSVNGSGNAYSEIEISSRIANIRKERIDIESKYLEELLNQLTEVFKKKSCYNSSTVSLNTIDHYTDETDMYDTPVVTHKKGSRKNVIGSETHGSIPKGWEIFATVQFDGELTTRMRNSILKDLLTLCGLEYNSEVEKEVKKNLKESRRQHGLWNSQLYYMRFFENAQY